MEDNDDKQKPEHMKTDPTISAASEPGLEVSVSREQGESQARPKPSSEIASSEQSFSVPRSETVNQRQNKPPLSDHLGTYINDRYRVEREIARGGMGRVYIATQLPLGRPVAIKVLRSEFTDGDPKFPKRFFLEASVSSQLIHPNIITIHDYGETDSGDLFMAMEFLDGVSLSHFIKKNAPLDENLIIHIALQIARAVRVAHKRGVIHRDLKPGNVMVVPRGEDEHFIKVLDFGLVKMLELPKQDQGKLDELSNLDPDDDNHPVNLTKAGVLLGSPRYMSPEQIRGEDLDARTDIYALGIILYQMLSGRSPFMGKTSIDVIYQHIHHSVPPITNVKCNKMLETIANQCLIKNRNERYSSMSKVIEVLKQAQAQLEGQSTGLISDSHSQEVVDNMTYSMPPDSKYNQIRNTSEQGLPLPATHSEAPSAFQESGININQDRTPTNSAQFVVQSKETSKLPMYLGTCGLLIAVFAIISILGLQEPRRVTTLPTKSKTIRKAIKPPVVKKSPILKSSIGFSSSPLGAEVYVDNLLIGTTPTKHKLTITDKKIEIRMKREGYKDWTQSYLLTNELQDIVANLVPNEPETPATSRKKPNRNRAKKVKAASSGKPKKTTATQTPQSDEKTDKTKDKKRKNYRNNPY